MRSRTIDIDGTLVRDIEIVKQDGFLFVIDHVNGGQRQATPEEAAQWESHTKVERQRQAFDEAMLLIKLNKGTDWGMTLYKIAVWQGWISESELH